MEHGILTTLFQLSLMASVMACLVFGIRFCLRNAPKIYTYILWIFVFVRGILPVSYSSAYSVWNLPRYFLPASNPAEIPAGSVMPSPAFDISMNAARAAALAPFTQTAQTERFSLAALFSNPRITASAIWCLGIAVMLLYSFFSLRRMKKTMAFSTLSDMDGMVKKCRIYESDQIQTAFILGFFHPAIYLPSGLSDLQKRLILEHETVHVRRHDHQVKMAAWLILSLHWFNPLIWASFHFLNKDMELSCDEQVVTNLGSQVRADYGSLLLALATSGRLPSGMPLAFSEGSAKARIKNILACRPVKFSSMAAATFLVIFTLYGCMGSPKQKEAALPENSETANDASESSPVNDEELAFVKTFIDNMLDNKPEKIYDMLSPELKAMADEPAYQGSGLYNYEKGKHFRINPFEPEDPPVIEKTDTGFSYRMRRPKNAPLAEYEKYHPSDVWVGEVSLESNGQGGLQVAKWEEDSYNEIASYAEYLWFTNPKTFGQSSIVYWVIEMLQKYPKTTAGKDPKAILTEFVHLTDGNITYTSPKENEQLVTYNWDDGSLTFHMKQSEEDHNWIILSVE